MATRYTDEFRRDAVRIATTSGLTRPQLSSDLGVGFESIWLTFLCLLYHYSGQGKLRTVSTGSKGSASSARHLASETRGDQPILSRIFDFYTFEILAQLYNTISPSIIDTYAPNGLPATNLINHI